MPGLGWSEMDMLQLFESISNPSLMQRFASDGLYMLFQHNVDSMWSLDLHASKG